MSQKIEYGRLIIKIMADPIEINKQENKMLNDSEDLFNAIERFARQEKKSLPLFDLEFEDE